MVLMYMIIRHFVSQTTPVRVIRLARQCVQRNGLPDLGAVVKKPRLPGLGESFCSISADYTVKHMKLRHTATLHIAEAASFPWTNMDSLFAKLPDRRAFHHKRGD